VLLCLSSIKFLGQVKLDNLTHSAICHSNLRYCIRLDGEKVKSLSINLQSGSEGGGDAFTLANLSPGDSGVDEIRGYPVAHRFFDYISETLNV
jgi:hypothetical protein